MVAADFAPMVDDVRINPPKFEQPPVVTEPEETIFQAIIDLVAMRPTAAGPRKIVEFKMMQVKENVTILFKDTKMEEICWVQPHISMMHMKITEKKKEMR